MTRTVRDAAMLLNVLAAKDPLDPATERQRRPVDYTYGGGLIYDALGSYNMAWRIGVAVGLAAGIVEIAFALIKPTAPPLMRTA
jgi:Asp-tRNA(Asn)/Glu-tRNA(Gln) amidotransferase A subunit family amidase